MTSEKPRSVVKDRRMSTESTSGCVVLSKDGCDATLYVRQTSAAELYVLQYRFYEYKKDENCQRSAAVAVFLRLDNFGFFFFQDFLV